MYSIADFSDNELIYLKKIIVLKIYSSIVRLFILQSYDDNNWNILYLVICKYIRIYMIYTIASSNKTTLLVPYLT